MRRRLKMKNDADADDEDTPEFLKKRQVPDDPPKRGSRLAPDWRPSDENCQRCQKLGLDLEAQITEFRNFWCALPGSRGRKLDWDRTFPQSHR